MYMFILVGIGGLIGTTLVGLIQDKYGHRYVMAFITSTVLICIPCLMIINYLGKFIFLAYISMLGVGMMNQSILCYLTILMGFQFENKVIPFATRLIIEPLAISLTILFMSVAPLDSPKPFYAYFGTVMAIGLTQFSFVYNMKFKGEK